MKTSVALTLGAAMLASSLLASAEPFTGSGYMASELLSPCQEADNDSRWGAAAETECEQYIVGFVDAMSQVGAIGAQSGVCPPAINTADEVRWAYMRWVHKEYSARRELKASDALMQTLKEAFPCK